MVAIKPAINDLSAYGVARSTIQGTPLDKEELRKTHAFWSACNYLALGMIYLQGNPLLREPLTSDHIKNNPTLLARITHEEVENLFKGYGYTPYFVEGSDAESMHQAMAATLDHCAAEIRTFQHEARTTGAATRPRWPMIVLRSPKGWVRGSMLSFETPLINDEDVDIPICVANADEAIAIIRRHRQVCGFPESFPVAKGS